jgi:hypothetical protein
VNSSENHTNENLMCGAKERQPIIKQISNNNQSDKNNKERISVNLFTQFGQN